MAYFGSRFVSKSLGFALGWMYRYILTITAPAEITAASAVIEYWKPPVNVAVWITLFMLVIIALNCFPVKYFTKIPYSRSTMLHSGTVTMACNAVRTKG